MLIKSGLVTQVSGSFGGMTGSHNRGGIYLRARTIPVNPSTIFQVELRAIFGSLVERWNNTLTQLQRDAWEIYASLVPLTGPLGDPVTVSGQNMFVRTNTPRGQALVTTIDDSPTQNDLGDSGLIRVGNALAAGDAFDISFDNTRAWANLTDGHAMIYIGRPQNATINYFRGPYRFVGTIDGAAIPPTSPATFTNPFPQAVGQRVFARIRTATADGRLSLETFSGPTLVA